MRSSLAKHIVQRLSSKWVRQIEIRFPVAPSIHFCVRCANICDERVFRREAAEAYTHGNQSFFFLDMPLWALLEQTEKTDFRKMQQNDHNYSSQVSRLHRSSLLPIARAFCCYTLRFSLPQFSAIQLRTKGTSILL